jgi:hypothetical protein
VLFFDLHKHTHTRYYMHNQRHTRYSSHKLHVQAWATRLHPIVQLPAQYLAVAQSTQGKLFVAAHVRVT